MPLARIAPTSLVYGAWDSRDTRVRIPRAIATTIRAVDVSVLTGSSQYSGAFHQAARGLDNAEWKKAAAAGLAPTPCIDRPGGILVHGVIVQSASVVLEGLRGYRTADASDVLPVYLLGLALGGLVTTGRRYRLRSGCTLVPSGPPEWRAVTETGERNAIVIDADTVVAELRAAARAWSTAADVPLGAEPTVHAFDPDRARTMSGTELRRRLALGLEIREWFTFPEIADELRRAWPPRHLQGSTVLFTGLSGAGKSTLANALVAMLRESGDRRVTLLDGEVVRKHLSSELGFSREHRELNLRRIGFVAAEITRNGAIAVCAPIAPYAAARRELRETIEAVGGFVEVHVSTPVEICEARDRKGLYARARAGLIKEFTGIDDPYEVPENPDIAIDTADILPDLAAHRIYLKLESLGFMR